VPAARRSTSLMKSMIGVSATRAESALHATGLRPIGAVTHAIVSRCAASVAATTAGSSAWPVAWTIEDRLPVTRHAPP